MTFSSCPLAPRPSDGSQRTTTRASGGGLGLGDEAMARDVVAVKQEPEPEPKPWVGEAGAAGLVALLPRPVEEPPMLALFVAKTYKMVADAAMNTVVSWAPGGMGNSFMVWDLQALANFAFR